MLTALAAISLIAMVVAYRTPTTVTLHRVYAEFTQISNFTYLAHVVPSVTYGNRTVVGVGDPLYTSLIKDIVLNMSYRIVSSRPLKQVVGVYNWSITLSSEAGWSKVLASKKALRFVGPEFRESFWIDMNAVKGIIHKIESETGLRSLRYVIHINMSVVTRVMLYDGRVVMLRFDPYTSIDMEKGKMSIAPLSMSSTRKLESVETFTNYLATPLGKVEVSTLRNAATLSSIASISVLGFLTIVAGRRYTRKLVDRVYRERLVIGSRSMLRTGNIIEIQRIEDLRRVADILDKPIVRIVDGGQIRYCVFDSAYAYCLVEQNGVRNASSVNGA